MSDVLATEPTEPAAPSGPSLVTAKAAKTTTKAAKTKSLATRSSKEDAAMLAAARSSYSTALVKASLAFAKTLETMSGAQLLTRAREIAQLDGVARATLGLDNPEKDQRTVINIGFLSARADEVAANRVAVSSTTLPNRVAVPLSVPALPSPTEVTG